MWTTEGADESGPGQLCGPRFKCSPVGPQQGTETRVWQRTDTSCRNFAVCQRKGTMTSSFASSSYWQLASLPLDQSFCGNYQAPSDDHIVYFLYLPFSCNFLSLPVRSGWWQTGNVQQNHHKWEYPPIQQS